MDHGGHGGMDHGGMGGGGGMDHVPGCTVSPSRIMCSLMVIDERAGLIPGTCTDEDALELRYIFDLPRLPSKPLIISPN